MTGSQTTTDSPSRSGTPRHYRARLRRHRIVIGVVIVGAAAAGTIVALDQGGVVRGAAMCTVTSPSSEYTLTPEQMSNAATIAAVASKVGLPDHAVTVGLATAMQESKLRNLPYGDRDSVGLFQQRPSQGWGTEAQIIQPVYAATAFYTALAKVTSWETLDVSVAAQRVQRSADGSAYSRWEGEARAVAVALTGQRGMALACAGGTVNYHQSASAITAATTDALGSNAFVAGAPTTTGWRTASYLVANAYADGVTSVSYAGNTWTAKRGTWRADAAAGNRVTFTTPSAPLNGPNG